MRRGPLALTLGDPAGVGPEIIVKAWAALRHDGPPFMAVGDLQVLSATSGAGPMARVTTPDEAIRVFPDALPVFDLPLAGPVIAAPPGSRAWRR